MSSLNDVLDRWGLYVPDGEPDPNAGLTARVTTVYNDDGQRLFGVHVDIRPDDLQALLSYAKRQYETGFEDGKAVKAAEIRIAIGAPGLF